MPQPIAYNTGSQTPGSLKLFGIEYAISSSIVSGSNNQRWFSAVNPGNGVVFVTSNYTQSYGTYQASVPLFFTASDYTDAAITGAVNGLPDRFGQVPFTTTASALQWVAQSGKYFMMNYEYPTIATDQLSLLLDYSFWGSYPTTGNTWYDVSGKNALGSLFNFTYDDSGIGLSTTSSVIVVQNNIPAISSSEITEFSIEFTAKLKQAFDSISVITFPTSTSYSEPTQSVAKYNNIVCTFSQSANSLTQITYLNGKEVSNNTATNASFNFSNAYNIAINTNNNAGTSKIGSVQGYNKALTPAEVSQNYYGGPIVTDGLVFAVDAGNLVSYENGSTTTYSLTGSSSGSLVNGVGYSSGNGGGWVFDGVDDVIRPQENTFNYSPGTTGELSLEMWVYPTGPFTSYLPEPPTTNLGGLFGQSYFNNSIGWGLGVTTISGIGNCFQLQIRNASTIVSTGVNVGGSGYATFTTGNWYHVVGSFTRNDLSRLYVNGELKSSLSSTPLNGLTLTPSLNDAAIGQIRNLFYSGCRVSVARLYNYPLSAQEVSQNFQAQRSRFGI
jgi:hypothetical protein